MSSVGDERGSFATLVAARRRALGLTRPLLATRAGVTVGTVRRIEAGQTLTPSPATLAALARALDLPLAALEAALPPAPVAVAGLTPTAPSWRRGCLGCGRPRGEVRQVLLAKLGAHGTLWLCHDCAANEHSVAELLATYRRTRGGDE